MDARTMVIAAMFSLTPVALVFLAAVVRGYTIDIHMTRERDKK